VEEETREAGKLLDTVADTLIRLAIGTRILLLMAIFAVYNVAAMVPAYRRIETLSGGVGALDLLIIYSPERAYDMIAAYGQQGRSYYATVALTLDTVFPVLLALVFSLVLTYVFHRTYAKRGVLHRAVLVPPAAMVADVLENFGIVTMLLAYPRKLPVVALLASAFSTVKWTAVSAEAVLVVVGLVSWLIKNGLRRDRTVW
jgi:hypothetical protein